MHHGTIFAAALLLLPLACAPEASGAPQEPPADALKPFEFLLGQWVAENELGADKYVVERNWRREFGGKFLCATEKLVVGSAEVFSEAWLGYDPGRARVTVWVFSSDGGYAVFDRVTASGDTVVLEGRIIGGRAPGPVRAASKRSGNDRVVETVEVQQDGAWVTRRTRNFVRRSSAGALTGTARTIGPASPALKSLDVLTGNWHTEGESEGVKYAVDYAMYWPLAGYFLRSDYSVTTNGQTELHAVSYMFADSESRALRQFGFSADGSVAAMKIVPSASSVLFDGEMVTPAPMASGPARRAPMRITYARPDADTLSATTETQRQDGTWRRAGAVSLKRRP